MFYYFFLYYQYSDLLWLISVFDSECLNDAAICVEGDGRARGQYAMCDDCSQFIKCDGDSSDNISCPDGLNYDATLGVCANPSEANCLL